MTDMEASASKVFAANLRMVMDAEGWSQTYVQRKSGAAQRSVSNALAGKNPTFRTAEALARACRVPLWRMLMPAHSVGDLRSGAPGGIIDRNMLYDAIDSVVGAMLEVEGIENDYPIDGIAPAIVSTYVDFTEGREARSRAGILTLIQSKSGGQHERARRARPPPERADEADVSRKKG